MSPTKAPARTAVKVDAAELKSAAAWASRVIPPRPAVPVLGAMVLHAGDGLLSLSAFDYETYVSVGVPADGEFEGRLLVHGRLLADAAARLTGTVSMTLDGSDLIVSAGRTSIRLRTMPDDDYPDVPPAAAPVGAIDSAVLNDVIHRAATCVTRDTSLPTLMLVRLVTSGTDDLTVWATDRYRAARITIPWTGDDFEALLPAAALANVLKGVHGTIRIGVDEHRVTFAGPDRTVTISRHIADYPPLDRLYPASEGPSVTVDREALASAIATARLSADGEAQEIWVEIADGAVVVTANSDRSTARSDIDGLGDLTVTWKVNSTYFGEIVGALPGTHVQLVRNPSDDRPEVKPFTVRGAGADGVGYETATFLLVPIRSLGGTR